MLYHLERRDQGLVELRTSQLNSCSYCLDMHSQDARAARERAALTSSRRWSG